VTPAPTKPPADAYQCISTAAVARALLAIILAPLHAFIEARLAGILARLEDMLTQWRNGTLPPPPPERPRANRPATPRAAAAPAYAEEPWLARLIALAASDRAPEPRPRPIRAPQPAAAQAPAPAFPARPGFPRAPYAPVAVASRPAHAPARPRTRINLQNRSMPARETCVLIVPLS
jgi:hypothetical protein